jgi:CheY-specific phosphatase CheX
MPARDRSTSITPVTLQTFERLRECMLASAAEVFEERAKVEYLDAEGSAWLAAGASPAGCFVTTIGYSAELMAGSVSLVAERDAIAPYLLSLGCQEQSDDEVSDACGEVCNMLIGRLKNKSRDAGLVLQIGTPITVIAAKLRMAPNEALTSTLYLVRFGTGNAFVRLDSAFQPGFSPRAPREESGIAAREGEGLFF